MKKTRSDFVVVTKPKRRLSKEQAAEPETPRKAPSWVELLEREAQAPRMSEAAREAGKLFAQAGASDEAGPRILPSLQEAPRPAEPQATPSPEAAPVRVARRRKPAPAPVEIAPIDVPVVAEAAPAEEAAPLSVPGAPSRRRARRLDRHELPPGQRWKRLLPFVLQTR